ncbi:hypothetical protein D3C87_2069920 [compost metagenome]
MVHDDAGLAKGLGHVGCRLEVVFDNQNLHMRDNSLGGNICTIGIFRIGRGKRRGLHDGLRYKKSADVSGGAP